MYIVVYSLFVYSVTDNCNRVETQLQLIHIIISYHIISYHIVSYRIISYHIYQISRIVAYHITSYNISHHIIPYPSLDTIRQRVSSLNNVKPTICLKMTCLQPGLPNGLLPPTFQKKKKCCPTISSLIISSFSEVTKLATLNMAIRKYILKIHNSFNKIN